MSTPRRRTSDRDPDDRLPRTRGTARREPDGRIRRRYPITYTGTSGRTEEAVLVEYEHPGTGEVWLALESSR